MIAVSKGQFCGLPHFAVISPSRISSEESGLEKSSTCSCVGQLIIEFVQVARKDKRRSYICYLISLDE